MYSREIGESTYTFKPSGGLWNASLVMVDRESDSYWSIVTEEAIYGPARGAELETLPGAVKTTWGEWRARHPDTRVLSVDDREHDPKTPYDRYFASEKGFRGLSPGDDRLAAKALVYGYEDAGEARAVPFGSVEGGGVVPLGERQLFLYRHPDDSHYRSTVALLGAPGARFEPTGGSWKVVLGQREARWEAAERGFGAGAPVEPFAGGIDTFWYIWRLSRPDTAIAETRR